MDKQTKRRPPQHLGRGEAEKTKKIARPGKVPGGASGYRQQPAGRGGKRSGSSERLFHETLLPRLERSHQANQLWLRAGVIWLFALPVLLAVIRRMTDSSKIAFLLIWIIGMFIVAGALVFVAYSDSELKRTLREVKDRLPEASDTELGGLVDLQRIRAELYELKLTPEELRSLLPHRGAADGREGGASDA